MRRNHKETPQPEAVLELRSSKMDILSRKRQEAVITIAPESSKRPTNQDFLQQTARPAEVLALGKNTAKQIIRLPVANTTRNTLVYPIMSIEFEQAGAGPPAKRPGKQQLLPRRPRKDQIALPTFRALMHKEKAHGENRMCTTAKQTIRLPVINTTRKKSIDPIKIIEMFERAGAGPPAKSPGKLELLHRTPKMDQVGLPTFRALMHKETAHGENSMCTTAKQNICSPVINTTRKKSIDPINTIELFELAGAGPAAKSPGKPQILPRRPRMDPIGLPLFRALMHREMLSKTSSNPQELTGTTEVKRMVDSVFESMLDSLIPQLKPDVCTERNPSTIDSLHSHEFDTVFDKILPSNDSDFNQNPVHEPRGSSDESSVTAQDIETLDIVKERIDSPRRSTKVPFSKVFDQASGPEIKAKDEVEDILADSGSMSHLDVPLTSRFKSDSESDTSVLELAATSPTEIVDHMSRSDKGAEEGLVAESDVELEQIMAAPSEENTPSDIISQSLELIGHHECASPVPSTPSSDQPEDLPGEEHVL
ncbi:hypothetical protein AMELA_G00084060 [Ameiurus melas]|uniref:Uncharacterized protein n=1 Tax=Ameiurus melas TaxID=219545 RepID=A0A7J6B4B4_AMEME|nr:hypothetical protein AMELA_G00084060 [Ameiurus melas]